MKEKVMVSIICLAYNNEPYIAQTLEGFVGQRTEYKFEVLINDDASTDRTADIIRKYEQKYPHIIKPVYQTENQYSKCGKGIKNLTMFLIEKAEGKYFAFCEGDDYWNSADKIQKQISYMEVHPECTLCIHNAIVVNEQGKIRGAFHIVKNDREVACDEVIRGGGEFCATNSIVGQMKLAKNPPDYLLKNGLDYTWQIYLASRGTTYCFKDYMSVYRSGVQGSWTDRMKKNPGAFSGIYERINQMLDEFNIQTGGHYLKSVEDRKLYNKCVICHINRDSKSFKNEDIKNWVRERNLIFRIKLYFWILCPRLYYFMTDLRGHLRM